MASVSAVYNASGHMVDVSEILSGTDVGIPPPLLHIVNLSMWYLKSIFVAGTHMPIAW